MRVMADYPPDAVTGCCFLTGRYERAEGEQVIWLDVDMDSLPPYGQLCISELAVKNMIHALGWVLMTPEMGDHIDRLEDQVNDLGVTIDELSSAMEGMVDVPAVKRALEVVARRVAGKDSLDEWLETLPRVSRK